MQLHFLFLNAACLVEKYLCSHDMVIAVYLQKKKLKLGVLFGLFHTITEC